MSCIHCPPPSTLCFRRTLFLELVVDGIVVVPGFVDVLVLVVVPCCSMLEVGRIKVDGKMHYGWNRAHFGAWCDP